MSVSGVLVGKSDLVVVLREIPGNRVANKVIMGRSTGY